MLRAWRHEGRVSETSRDKRTASRNPRDLTRLARQANHGVVSMELIRCRAALIVLAGALVGASIDASQAPVASQAAATKPCNQERLARIRAELFAGTNRPDDAVRELKEILAVDPGSAEGHMLLGTKQTLKDVVVNQMLMIKEP